jgi:hypothetical protein
LIFGQLWRSFGALGGSELVKRTPFLILLSVVFICSTYYFIFLSPQARVHRVGRDYLAAIQQLNQSPPGIQRAQTFIQRVRAISAEPAPPEIQQDLRDYADALDRALQDYRNVSDTKADDQKTDDIKAKLVADIKKYE